MSHTSSVIYMNCVIKQIRDVAVSGVRDAYVTGSEVLSVHAEPTRLRETAFSTYPEFDTKVFSEQPPSSRTKIAINIPQAVAEIARRVMVENNDVWTGKAEMNLSSEQWSVLKRRTNSTPKITQHHTDNKETKFEPNFEEVINLRDTTIEKITFKTPTELNNFLRAVGHFGLCVVHGADRITNKNVRLTPRKGTTIKVVTGAISAKCIPGDTNFDKAEYRKRKRGEHLPDGAYRHAGLYLTFTKRKSSVVGTLDVSVSWHDKVYQSGDWEANVEGEFGDFED